MHANITSRELLAYARDTALGLADVHEIDGSNTVATLVHHDFSPKNLLLSTDNKIKLSDFNDGQLLRWDFAKNQRCKGFDWDNLCGTTVERTNRRSPEECAGPRKRYGTTERTEVYHLGTIFHFMLSKEQFPYQFEERTLNGTLYQPDPKVVKQLILNGEQPPLPPEIEESKDPAIQAIIRAMRKAFTFDAKERPSAREIAKLLDESTFNDTRNVNDKSPDLDEPSRPLNLSKTDTNSRVAGSKQDRRDLYDLQQDGDQPDAASKQSVEGNKRTSVFALDDENLKSFDPYSSVGAF
jgi:serine/threonine protein kinase